jgi:GDPmannose 4,6-dehydratase
VQHSVREFAQLAFRYVGIELEFKGEGADEKGIVKSVDPASAAADNVKVGDVLVEVSADFYRPTDVVNLWGDPTKARAELGWNPQATSFEQLVKIMVDSDMAKVAVERASEKVKTNLAEYLEKGIVK